MLLLCVMNRLPAELMVKFALEVLYVKACLSLSVANTVTMLWPAGRFSVVVPK